MKIHHGFLLLFLCAVTPLCAQVSYVKDLVKYSAHPNMRLVVPVVKAPVDTSDPLYDQGTPDTQLIFTIDRFHFFDPANGVLSSPRFFPPGVKLDENSWGMFVGELTSAPTLLIWSSDLRAIYNTSFNNDTQTLTVQNIVYTPLGYATSFAAADRSNVTALADEAFHSINLTSGTSTQHFTLSGGTAAGEFSTDTLYHAYSPNGLVYLLDYGNNRVQALDPANNFAFANEFTLEIGTTTANMQFAIGSNGNLYLGDGLGGGSVYSPDGDFIAAFTLPVVGTETEINPYLTIDASGHVYVFDHTGFHQYLDASVVPEPSASALLIALGVPGALGLAILRRHRRNQPGRSLPSP